MWSTVYSTIGCGGLPMKMSDNRYTLRLPTTAIFEHTRLLQYFPLSQDGSTSQVPVEGNGGVKRSDIFRDFINRASCPIIACMIWYERQTHTSGSFSKLQVRYLDEDQLRAVLLSSGKGNSSIPTCPWILQSFVLAQPRSRHSTIVAESLCNQFEFRKFTNKSVLQGTAGRQGGYLQNACLTVDDLSRKHVNEEKVSIESMRYIEAYSSHILSRVLRLHKLSARDATLTLHFRVDLNANLWLLWANFEPLMQFHKQPNNDGYEHLQSQHAIPSASNYGNSVEPPRRPTSGNYRMVHQRPSSGASSTTSSRLHIPNAKKLALFSGGYFWDLQAIFHGIAGVVSSEVGYCGGITAHPTYADVESGQTGHCQCVRVVYNTSNESMSFELLLQVYFSFVLKALIDLQLDENSPYRASVYCYDDDQRTMAEAFTRRVMRLHGATLQISVEAVPQVFWRAEEEYQQYHRKQHERVQQLAVDPQHQQQLLRQQNATFEQLDQQRALAADDGDDNLEGFIQNDDEDILPMDYQPTLPAASSGDSGSSSVNFKSRPTGPVRPRPTSKPIDSNARSGRNANGLQPNSDEVDNEYLGEFSPDKAYDTRPSSTFVDPTSAASLTNWIVGWEASLQLEDQRFESKFGHIKYGSEQHSQTGPTSDLHAVGHVQPIPSRPTSANRHQAPRKVIHTAAGVRDVSVTARSITDQQGLPLRPKTPAGNRASATLVKPMLSARQIHLSEHRPEWMDPNRKVYSDPFKMQEVQVQKFNVEAAELPNDGSKSSKFRPSSAVSHRPKGGGLSREKTSSSRSISPRSRSAVHGTEDLRNDALQLGSHSDDRLDIKDLQSTKGENRQIRSSSSARGGKRKETDNKEPHDADLAHQKVPAAGSKSLQWSKRFGEAGRKATELKLKNKAKASAAVAPPPVQSDDLLIICLGIVSKMSDTFIKMLCSLEGFARKRKEDVLNVSLMMESGGGPGSRTPTRKSATAVEDSMTISMINGISTRTDAVLVEVIDQFREKQSQQFVKTMNGTHSNDINADDQQFSIAERTTPSASQVRLVEGGIGSTDQLDGQMDTLQKQQFMSELGINGDDATRANTNSNAKSKTFKGKLKHDGENALTPQAALLTLLDLMACVPNIRPADELSEIILWLMGNIEYSAIKAHLKAVIDGFRAYLSTTLYDLKDISHIQSDRSSKSEKEHQKQQAGAAHRLRKWHTERMVQITVNKDSPAVPETSTAPAMPSIESGSPSRIRNLAGEDKTYSHYNGSPDKMFDGFKRPLSAGVVRPIGRAMSATKADRPPQEASAASISTAVVKHDPSKVAVQNVAVMRHDGMDAFLEFTEWEREHPSIKELCRSVINKQNLLPASVIEDTYDEYWGGEFSGNDNFNDGNRSMKSTPGRKKKNRSKKAAHLQQEQQQLLTAELMSGFDAHGSLALSVGDTHTLGTCNTGFSSYDDSELQSPRSVMSERATDLYRSTSETSSQQKAMLLVALLSDFAQAIMLNLVVLVKHAFAGKYIEVSDIKVLFGENATQHLGRQNISKLLDWLHANQRSDIRFRLPSHTYTDAALQKVYSYFPQLALQFPSGGSGPPHYSQLVASAANADDDDRKSLTHQGASSAFAPSCVRLVWLDKHRVNKLFRDPTLFDPNVNCLWS